MEPETAAQPEEAAPADLGKLWARYRPELYAFALAALRHEGDADDLVQEVSVVVIRRAEEFRPGTSFGAWVREIARRCLLDRVKKRPTRVRTLDPDVLECLDVAAREVERSGRAALLSEALAECLEELRPLPREVLERRYRDGQPVEAIAAAAGRTV